MVPDPAVFGPATLAATTALNAFYQYMPKLSECRREHPDDNPAFAADVRMGEIAAVTMSAGVGVICSSLTGSPVPAITALVVAGILVTLYESTLRQNRPLEKRGDALTTAAAAAATAKGY